MLSKTITRQQEWDKSMLPVVWVSVVTNGQYSMKWAFFFSYSIFLAFCLYWKADSREVESNCGRYSYVTNTSTIWLQGHPEMGMLNTNPAVCLTHIRTHFFPLTLPLFPFSCFSHNRKHSIPAHTYINKCRQTSPVWSFSLITCRKILNINKRGKKARMAKAVIDLITSVFLPKWPVVTALVHCSGLFLP